MLPAALLGIITLIVLGIVSYANGFGAPFVFDDLRAIVDNPHVRQLWPLTQAISAPEQSGLAGRPVVSLSLAINYAVGGLSPVGFHVWNLAVHITAALLLLAIARKTLSDRTAFVIAALWLVHPLQTETVDYVIQRTESMMALFAFATLYAAIRRWHSAAVALCALGMATKESMVAAPLIVLAYDVAFEAGTVKRALAARPRFYAALAATWIVLVVLNASGPRSHTAGFSTPVTPWVYLLNQAAMIGTYLKLVVWPRPLILDYGPVQPISMAAVWPQFALLTILVAATSLAWRRRPDLAFLGTWFFVTLAPASSIVPIATEVGAERRMYVPLAAVIVLLVVGAEKALRRIRFFAPAAAVAALSACIAFTVQRNAAYTHPIDLWRGVIAYRPHGRAHHALGFALQQDGRRSEAISEYRLATAEYPLAHYNLALLLAADGQLPAAIDELRLRLRREPHDADSRGALADFLLREQRFSEAAAEYSAYLAQVPENAAAHNNLGLALIRLDRVGEAIAQFRAAVALAPADAGATQNLARALALFSAQQRASRALGG